MMSLNRYRLKHLSGTGHRGAKRAIRLLKRPDRLIGLILIGNNLVNILASAIATVIAIRLFGDAGIVIATITLTFVILIFAEITPKTIAASAPRTGGISCKPDSSAPAKTLDALSVIDQLAHQWHLKVNGVFPRSSRGRCGIARGIENHRDGIGLNDSQSAPSYVGQYSRSGANDRE